MLHPVVFVSLGPGEAELITLKGLKVLQAADLIFYPSTRRGDKEVSRALGILSELGIPHSKTVPFSVPMSKERTPVLKVYEDVAGQLAEQHLQNRKVVIVAEGDSGFYSSTYYVYEWLEKKGIPSERVAGIPAFIAAGTLAKLHIAKLEEELHVIPGNVRADDLRERILRNNSVVVMKTSICEEEVKKCITNFREATYHYFENVGTDGKEFYTTVPEEILERKFPYFSLMIIQKKS